MTAVLKIDFVSDVSCPWCAVGLGALQQALTRLELALKHALLSACHRDRQAMDEPAVLLAAAAAAGLDPGEAARILESDRYVQEVRTSQAYYRDAGIHAVPAVVVNDRHLISGGQPSAVFEQALQQIAAELE
jgi:predicted DsbA family dithiol-disulfide isomerase